MAQEPLPVGTTSRIVALEAAPTPISIDLTQTAVLVIDMQNDFGAEGGLFHRAGIDITPIQEVIRPTAHVLAAARRAGIKIIYLKIGLSSRSLGFCRFSGRSQSGPPSAVWCRRDSASP